MLIMVFFSRFSRLITLITLLKPGEQITLVFEVQNSFFRVFKVSYTLITSINPAFFTYS